MTGCDLPETIGEALPHLGGEQDGRRAQVRAVRSHPGRACGIQPESNMKTHLLTSILTITVSLKNGGEQVEEEGGESESPGRK